MPKVRELSEKVSLLIMIQDTPKYQQNAEISLPHPAIQVLMAKYFINIYKESLTLYREHELFSPSYDQIFIVFLYKDAANSEVLCAMTVAKSTTLYLTGFGEEARPKTSMYNCVM